MPLRSIFVPAGPKFPLIDRQSPASRSGFCSQSAATFTPRTFW
jgi:hypothetical protein